MADRAEKCAEKIVADVFPSMDTNCAVRYVEQAKKIIRSHYPDDRELLEAAKAALDFVTHDFHREGCPSERLRTAIAKAERRG